MSAGVVQCYNLRGSRRFCCLDDATCQLQVVIMNKYNHRCSCMHLCKNVTVCTLSICTTENTFYECLLELSPHSFYLQATQQYELLNYSVTGTMVNSVLYGCDFSEKSYSNDQNIPIEVTDVRDINKSPLSKIECMASKPNKVRFNILYDYHSVMELVR